MAEASHERLVSADSHVTVTHDAVKEHLATKFHDDYDRAVDGGRRRRRDPAGPEPDAAAASKACATPSGVPATATRRAPQGHGPGRRRRRGLLLRVQRVPLPVPDQERVARGDAGVQRHARRVRRPPTRSASSRRTRSPSTTSPSRSTRCTASPTLGGKSLQLPVYPIELGAPDYYDRSYDPLWAAIQETGLPACFHIGLAPITYYQDELPQFAQGTIQPMSGMFTSVQYGNFILSGVFERFPDLKTVWVEPGVGWIPWWLFHLDEMEAEAQLPVRRDPRSAELLLPAQHVHDVHPRAVRGAQPALRASASRT